MLALTHHKLVRVAAVRAGLIGFSDYAVFGDDFVIANDAVTSEYLKIHGVFRNIYQFVKSLESDRFLEFAKRWIGPNGVKLTPIGPGLILKPIWNKFYLASLSFEMFKLGLINTIPRALTHISSPRVIWAEMKCVMGGFRVRITLKWNRPYGCVCNHKVLLCFTSAPPLYDVIPRMSFLQDKLCTTRKAESR